MPNYNSEAILPAAECLFDKKKVTPIEIAKEFDNSTLLVFGNGKKRKFVCTCNVMGSTEMAAELGKVKTQHHDQRGTTYGDWQIMGFVVIEHGIVASSYGEDHRTSNLAFAVYK